MLSKKLIIAMMFILMLAAGGVQAGGDVENGKALSVDCADCHGDDGLGDEEVPGIAGMDAAAHAKKLADFKSGAIESEMADYVGDLSEQDMLDYRKHFMRANPHLKVDLSQMRREMLASLARDLAAPAEAPRTAASAPRRC